MAEKTNDVQRNWLQAYYKETVVPALIKELQLYEYQSSS